MSFLQASGYYYPSRTANARDISTERRRAWLKAISRQDLTADKLANVFVCEHHFVGGMPNRL